MVMKLGIFVLLCSVNLVSCTPYHYDLPNGFRLSENGTARWSLVYVSGPEWRMQDGYIVTPGIGVFPGIVSEYGVHDAYIYGNIVLDPILPTWYGKPASYYGSHGYFLLDTCNRQVWYPITKDELTGLLKKHGVEKPDVKVLRPADYGKAVRKTSSEAAGGVAATSQSR